MSVENLLTRYPPSGVGLAAGPGGIWSGKLTQTHRLICWRTWQTVRLPSSPRCERRPAKPADAPSTTKVAAGVVAIAIAHADG